MNKKELVDEVAAMTGCTKKEVSDVYGAIIEVIKQEIVNGGNVSVVGFGTFTSRFRRARNVRNFQTGETVEVPDRYTPFFKYSTSFKKKFAGENTIDMPE